MEPYRFKLGDFVYVDGDTDGPYKITGEQRSPFQSHSDKFTLDGKRNHLVPSGQLTLTPKFKVGDVITGTSCGNELTYTGEIIKVDLNDAELTYLIEHDDGQCWLRTRTCTLAPTKPKFEIGDLVTGESIYNGKTYIGKIDSDMRGIEPAGYRVETNAGCVTLLAATLTLVSPQKSIVCRMVKGMPQPSSRPAVHDTADIAKAECERLALHNPGNVYAVFIMGNTAEAEAVLKAA